MTVSIDPIKYTLRFPAPQTHYVEVAAAIPTGGRKHVDLFMAVWTPGSYLIREYQRHVENLTARSPSGAVLAVEKSAKNRWRVETGGAPAIEIAYRVYRRERTLPHNRIEAARAMRTGPT